jgi:TonB-linked SusC/RagA family outer membrane protein
MNSGGYLANMMVDYGANTNWPALLTNKDNFSQDHTLSLSGGSAKSNYRASVFYKDMNPIAIRSNQSNWGGRLNINHLGLNDRLEVQLNVSTNFANRDATNTDGNWNAATSGAWEQVSQRNPTEPAKDENGKWIQDQAYNSWNPLANYATLEDRLYRTSWLGSGKATFTIIDGLKISEMASYQQYQRNRNQYYTRDSKNSVDNVSGGGRAQKWFAKDDRRSFETTLDFVRTFNKIHSFNAVIGQSYEYHVYEDFNAWNSGFLTDAFKYNNLGNGTGIAVGTSRSNMGSTKNDDKLAAFFGRINYTLMDKYLLSAVYRYEGSSRFGPAKRWGSFPAISAGWILSHEDFIKNLAFINNLKFRLGYGVTGNLPKDNYLYMTTLSTGGQYPIGATWFQTYGPARNPNPNLQWEKKEEFNIGFDYSFLNDRLGGTIDYYSRTTKNVLYNYNAQLPPFVLSSLYTNVGTINNSGIEIGINAAILKMKDFSWDLNGTFFNQNNKLVSLSNDIYKATYIEWGGLPAPGALGNAIRTQEGKPLGQFYGKRFAGFDSDGKWLFYNKDNQKVPLADMTTQDLTYIGNGVPKYYASLTNTFRYKGFDLTVFFRGKFGYKILNLKDLFFGNLTWLPNNVLKSAITKNAQLHDAPQYSDYYLEPGDFVKLDNLTLGYTFKFKNQNWVRNLRVYATGLNLATFTKYSGTNPETEDTGFTTGIESRDFYPVASTLMFGVNIGF